MKKIVTGLWILVFVVLPALVSAQGVLGAKMENLDTAMEKKIKEARQARESSDWYIIQHLMQADDGEGLRAYLSNHKVAEKDLYMTYIGTFGSRGEVGQLLGIKKKITVKEPLLCYAVSHKKNEVGKVLIDMRINVEAINEPVCWTPWKSFELVYEDPAKVKDEEFYSDKYHIPVWDKHRALVFTMPDLDKYAHAHLGDIYPL